MQERYLGRLEPGMDVCDINGDKIGTVAHVYRYDLAAVAGSSADHRPHEEIVEVKTGFLGFGKHLYIPLSAVEDVTTGCIFLAQPKDEVESGEWATRPAHLDDLH